MSNVGVLGHMYLEILRLQLGCRGDSELWLDSSRGVLCRGPEGPHCRIPPSYSDYKSALPNVLSDGKLLQQDALVQYLATLKLSEDLDPVVVEMLANPFSASRTTGRRVDRPTVISSLTNTTIAVADAGMSSIRESGNCLGEREVLSNGLTRFTLEHRGRRLELGWGWVWFEVRDAWMAQSPMAFHAHGIPLEGDLSEYDLIIPERLRGTLPRSATKQRRRRECAPIYLFAYPSRISTFWSFEEDGHLPIPDDLCKYLGLPIKLSLAYYQDSFPTLTYKAMRDYQVLRGLDPATADFARHSGFYNYKFYPVQSSPAVATTSGRFEDLDDSVSIGVKSHSEDVESVYTSLPALFSDVPVEDGMSTDAPEPAESSGVMTSVWSRLTSSFSWTASEDSDILAVGF
ncbi:hypothetical protein V5O48_006012 [Marasmius crinis-equi]|uniref:Uncharacterized protein n=1 Tax=Marasmius crinis-equi TaxID=585013 RepID=A0ABR3FKW6_9AGAR